MKALKGLPVIKITPSSKSNQANRVLEALQDSTSEQRAIAAFAEGPNARSVALRMIYRIYRDIHRNPVSNQDPQFYLTRTGNKIAVIVKLGNPEKP